MVDRLIKPIAINFLLLANGTSSYTLTIKAKVIKPGKLGIELKSDAQKAGGKKKKISVFYKHCDGKLNKL